MASLPVLRYRRSGFLPISREGRTGAPVGLEDHAAHRFDADPIVHGAPQLLLTSQTSLRRPDANVTEQKADLLEFAACQVTQPLTCVAQCQHAAGEPRRACGVRVEGSTSRYWLSAAPMASFRARGLNHKRVYRAYKAARLQVRRRRLRRPTRAERRDFCSECLLQLELCKPGGRGAADRQYYTKVGDGVLAEFPVGFVIDGMKVELESQMTMAIGFTEPTSLAPT